MFFHERLPKTYSWILKNWSLGWNFSKDKTEWTRNEVVICDAKQQIMNFLRGPSETNFIQIHVWHKRCKTKIINFIDYI